MASVEERFEQLAAEASYHQHYAREIENQMRAIAQVESEINKTIEALRNIKENNTSLFSIGSGIFVRGELKQANKVLVNVGANIFIENSVEDTIKFLEEKKKELEEAKNELIKSMETIASRLKEIDIEARRIMKEKEIE
ncbi:MAG: prefoldin subunit alpha [Candidatus Micrarchaeota archaeon]|nr:prefoldin subunit alpha [Candidatus Micrarchaeota archaeon]